MKKPFFFFSSTEINHIDENGQLIENDLGRNIEQIISPLIPNVVFYGSYCELQTFSNRMFQTKNNNIDYFRDKEDYFTYFISVGAGSQKLDQSYPSDIQNEDYNISSEFEGFVSVTVEAQDIIDIDIDFLYINDGPDIKEIHLGAKNRLAHDHNHNHGHQEELQDYSMTSDSST